MISARLLAALQVPTPIAIVLGVTVILLISEIIPQAACKAYGIAIGGRASWLVRFISLQSVPLLQD